jgi:protoporphyrinogen oxidase|nr:FAD-dependent oxidoreductase [Kofleriaceae bacterium]
MTETVDALVIGAGVSGLSFANWYRERHAGARVVVAEAEAEPGGYCRTVARDGFVWDYSGHFFHFKHADIEAWLRARMPGEEVRTIVKRSFIRYAGRDIDFPFQKNIHQLPHDEFLECLVDLFFRPGGDAPPTSFGDMLSRRLGRAITDKFLRPYNEKLYATELDRLDVDAMGRFFPHAEVADVIANMRPGAKDGGYNATFTYPAGGAMSYVRALLRDLPADAVACGDRVTAIDLDARVATTASGRRFAYRHVVSSAPLPALARACGVAHDAAAFTSNRVLVFNLGFDRKGMRDVHWMYFPSRDRVFYRVGWYDNMFDTPRMSLYVEIGARAGEVLDVPALRARVLADLRAEGIVTDHQLAAEHSVVLDPAYCHITKASLAETARLRGSLAARGVHSVGRYGAWTYCSIEDNMLETRALAATLS